MIWCVIVLHRSLATVPAWGYNLSPCENSYRMSKVPFCLWWSSPPTYFYAATSSLSCYPESVWTLRVYLFTAEPQTFLSHRSQKWIWSETALWSHFGLIPLFLWLGLMLFVVFFFNILFDQGGEQKKLTKKTTMGTSWIYNWHFLMTWTTDGHCLELVWEVSLSHVWRLLHNRGFSLVSSFLLALCAHSTNSTFLPVSLISNPKYKTCQIFPGGSDSVCDVKIMSVSLSHYRIIWPDNLVRISSLTKTAPQRIPCCLLMPVAQEDYRPDFGSMSDTRSHPRYILVWFRRAGGVWDKRAGGMPWKGMYSGVQTQCLPWDHNAPCRNDSVLFTAHSLSLSVCACVPSVI